MKKYIKPVMDVMNLDSNVVLLQASPNDIPVSDDTTVGTGGIKARPQFSIWGSDPVEE